MTVAASVPDPMRHPRASWLPGGGTGAGGLGGDAVETPAQVTEIRQVGDAVYAWAGDHWFAVSLCTDQPLCLTPGQPPELPAAPDGIPNGTVAYADGEGITSAWYTEPTDRYPHGALGDKIEAGAMVVQDVYGHRVTVELPADQVFEDLTPRIADLDGDGRNEVLAIRSSLRAGAALVAYDLAGSSLIEINSTPPVGRPTAGSMSPASAISPATAASTSPPCARRTSAGRWRS